MKSIWFFCLSGRFSFALYRSTEAFGSVYGCSRSGGELGVPMFRNFYLSLAFGVNEGESSETRLKGIVDLGYLNEFCLCESNLLRFSEDPARYFFKFWKFLNFSRRFCKLWYK